MENNYDLLMQKLSTREGLIEEIEKMKNSMLQGLNPTRKDKIVYKYLKKYVEEELSTLEESEELIISIDDLEKLKNWTDKFMDVLEAEYDEEISNILYGRKRLPSETFVTFLYNDSTKKDGIIVTERDGMYILREYFQSFSPIADDFFASLSERKYNKSSDEPIIQKIKNIPTMETICPIEESHFQLLEQNYFQKLQSLHKKDKGASIFTLIKMEELEKFKKLYSSKLADENSIGTK